MGKSFLVAQIAYHVSTGQKLWEYDVRSGTVLYLALEDDYQRLQERMFRMFGVEGTDKLHFATYEKQLGNGLDEQLDTHEQHLDVLDFKKQERQKEVETLDEQITAKRDEVKNLSQRVQNFDGGLKELQEVGRALDFDESFQLPDPPGLMSAKTYKQKFAEPLVKKLKVLVKKVLARCFEALDNYYRLNVANGNLYRENERLSKINEQLVDENSVLRTENKDYKLLRKVFGSRQIDNLIEQARQSKQHKKRIRDHYER